MCCRIYAVLKHRDVHEQVLAEVDGVFAAGPVTPESLRNMRVLHGAVMETLRMYPIAVAAMRNATRDFEFAGHLVEKDEPLFIAITVSHFLEPWRRPPSKKPGRLCPNEAGFSTQSTFASAATRIRMG